MGGEGKGNVKVQRIGSNSKTMDGKKPMILIDCLSKPITEGGIKLIDIPARNEAIELMWLKSYLDLSEK